MGAWCTRSFSSQREELDYAVWHGRRQGKAWDDFQAHHAKMTIVTTTDYGTAVDMADAVRCSQLAAPYLTEAEFEKTLQWIDTLTGIRCKARADIPQPESPRARRPENVRQHRRAPLRLIGRATRIRRTDRPLWRRRAALARLGAGKCAVIAVEKKPPHGSQSSRSRSSSSTPRPKRLRC